MKNPKKVITGKKSRSQGKAFELKVRADLEEKGWIVDRWSNNIDLEKDKLVSAKSKWMPNRPMMLGAGFPDFIAFRSQVALDLYEIIGVECKMTGKLDHEEKEKCKWYLANGIFSGILIASKTKVKNKIVVEYNEWKPQ